MKYLSQEDFEKKRRQQLLSKIKSFNKHKEKKREEYNNSENRYLQEVRFSNKSGSHIGDFRFSPGAESPEHIVEKFLKYAELRYKGHKVLVEAIFNDSQRCDILDLSEGKVWEIGVSEDEEDFKKKSYPVCFTCEFIKINGGKENGIHEEHMD